MNTEAKKTIDAITEQVNDWLFGETGEAYRTLASIRETLKEYYDNREPAEEPEQTHGLILAGEDIPEWANWVARDDDGELWAFEDKPKRSHLGDFWIGEEREGFLSSTLFPSVQWSDAEPTRIIRAEETSMKYKAGDKVRVRKDLQDGEVCGVLTVAKGMVNKRGETLEIVSSYKDGRYCVRNSGFYWTDEMFEGVVQPDNVNHPQHYKQGAIETLDIIRMSLTDDEYRGFLKGNVLKYQMRAPYKHETPDEDWAKAKFYYDEYRDVTE